MAESGLDPRINQVNNSFTKDAGTLRGLHYQVGPAAETKLVRAVRGAVFDVVVDLRPDSPTFKSWASAELTDENRKMMYVPRGCGHAILTLVEDTELVYFASQAYSGEHERGVRWDDPAFNVDWPIEPAVISKKDASWPDFGAE
jgi:dTDP-4-dehydrorhamnose 3,5-epimerase